MKSKILIAFIFLMSSTIAFAQDCEAYIPTKMNQKLTYKNLDKKGKILSFNSQELISKNNIDGGVEFAVHSVRYDDKKKKTDEDTVKFYCKDNTFYVDMNAYLNKEQLKSYDETQIEINFSEMGYPKNLTVGTTLEDGFVEAVINAGITLTFRTDITDRKVLALEDVTTEAGTFKAFKISQNIVSNLGFMSIKMTGISWIKLNVGDIKSEVYDSKGNLVSSNVLISIE